MLLGVWGRILKAQNANEMEGRIINAGNYR